MATSLAGFNDLEDVYRPLDPSELQQAGALLLKASALLRQRAPYVDSRIANGTLDPLTAATVVATMVKRFLVNPNQVVSETTGPNSVNYAQRSAAKIGGTAPGGLQVTDEDLELIRPPRKRASVGSIRVRPAMAPRPIGRYGPLPTSAGQVIGTMLDYDQNLDILFPGLEGPHDQPEPVTPVDTDGD